jgi:LmbE family N-acetylglucosaminyl deacetylase
VEASCFYAGLRNRGAGVPHRPAALFAYMQHDPFEPSFIVDVTAVWEAKLAALREYRSQLHQEKRDERDSRDSRNGKDEAPMTKVATPEFWLAVEGRARHFGLLIGAAFGEPFWSRLPLAVADPIAILPGGVR